LGSVPPLDEDLSSRRRRRRRRRNGEIRRASPETRDESVYVYVCMSVNVYA
jgi:hypothetical protein